MPENNEPEKSQVSLITEGAAKSPAILGLWDGRKGDTWAGGLVSPNSLISAAFSGDQDKLAQNLGSQGT